MSADDSDRRPSRARALSVAVAVLVILAAAWVVRVQSQPVAPAQTGGPSAALDDALASGTPAYVLIHSLT